MARFEDQAAYDALPSILRQAVQQSVGGADAREVFAHYAKHGSEKTLKWIRREETALMTRHAFYLRGTNHLIHSSYVACKVKPLRSTQAA